MFCYYWEFNQPHNNLDTSAVTNMSFMFNNCYEFNQPFDNWNTANVTNMSHMFYNCNEFNQPLDNWDMHNVTIMSFMFYRCSKFNPPLNNWDISAVKDMTNMFIRTKMSNYKFPKTKIRVNQTIKSNEINSIRCIICINNGYDKLYKLCLNDNNDHYYCENCCYKLSKIKCCICKTNPHIVEYIMTDTLKK